MEMQLMSGFNIFQKTKIPLFLHVGQRLTETSHGISLAGLGECRRMDVNKRLLYMTAFSHNVPILKSI